MRCMINSGCNNHVTKPIPVTRQSHDHYYAEVVIHPAHAHATWTADLRMSRAHVCERRVQPAHSRGRVILATVTCYFGT